jgi:phage anti-repressor protein
MVPELSLQTVQSLVTSNDPFPVGFDYFWEWVGYSNKANAKKALTSNFLPNKDFTFFIQLDEKSERGRPTEEIKLSVPCAKKMAMMARTEKGDQVREYFLQCEVVAKSGSAELLRTLTEACELMAARIDSIEARLPRPSAPKRMTDGARRSSIAALTLQPFLDERCTLQACASGTSKELYDAYVGFCRARGLCPVTWGLFGRRLGDYGFTKVHTHTGNVWFGLSLKASAGH